MNALETMIGEHPFLCGVRLEHLQLLAGCARKVGFDAEEFLFRSNEPADRFFLVISGSVALKVFIPGLGPMPIQTIAAGEALGWSWLLPPYRWHFDARALDQTLTVAFDAGRLRQLLDSHPELGCEVLKRVVGIVAQRLQATRLQLLDLYEVRT